MISLSLAAEMRAIFEHLEAQGQEAYRLTVQLRRRVLAVYAEQKPLSATTAADFDPVSPGAIARVFRERVASGWPLADILALDAETALDLARGVEDEE